jgi:hydroxymethylbilane synthase
VVLAAAGLARLGLEDLPAHPIPPEVMLPAPGQGTLAVEVRRGGTAEALCRVLDHPPTARAAAAERSVVAAFGGDCTLPLAAWAREDGDGRLLLSALLATPDGRRVARGEGSGADPATAAAACIAALRAAGAEDVLAELRR